MGIHQIDRIAGYVRYLQENPQEVDLLFKELLIGVTSFFRDPAAWEKLQNDAILPRLLANRSGRRGAARLVDRLLDRGRGLFAGHDLQGGAGEAASPRSISILQIFATDLDPDAIDKARQGNYPANIVADVSAERLKRFFIQEGDDLPGRQGDPGDGDLRHPERHHGPPLYQARSSSSAATC